MKPKSLCNCHPDAWRGLPSATCKTAGNNICRAWRAAARRRRADVAYDLAKLLVGSALVAVTLYVSAWLFLSIMKALVLP